MIVTSGGIGGNHDLVRKNWPTRLGAPPRTMICGVPDHVDGRMLGITEAAGGSVINRDRMWHYTEGIQNWSPIWTRHGIRILPRPVVALARRARASGCRCRCSPASTRSARSRTSWQTGYDHSWFVLNQKIIEREFALSGSEQNPDLTSGSWAERDPRAPRRRRAGAGARPSWRRAPTSSSSATSATSSQRMNELTGEDLLDAAEPSSARSLARDREIDNAFTKDAQVTAIRGARNYLGDKLIRVAKPHRLLDPAAGPLIAVRL